MRSGSSMSDLKNFGMSLSLPRKRNWLEKDDGLVFPGGYSFTEGVPSAPVLLAREQVQRDIDRIFTPAQ